MNGICFRCFNCMHADCNCCDKKRCKSSEDEHPPLDLNSECKILQPSVHAPPGNGKSDQAREEDTFNKIFGKKSQQIIRRCSQYFPDSNFFRSSFSCECRKSEESEAPDKYGKYSEDAEYG